MSRKLMGVIFGVLLLSVVEVFAKSYEVIASTGKIRYEDSGVLKEVQLGQTFKVKTGKGFLRDLLPKKTSLKKGEGLTISRVAPASNTPSKGVSTASSRASEAKEDVDWDE